MRRPLCVAISAVAAAIITHGMVFSGVHFDDSPPVSSYQSVFRSILLAVERLWSGWHGWQPLSHIRDFAGFYTGLVHVICPLLGFGLFWMVSRTRFGFSLWKPLAIALICAAVPASPLVWVEAARTTVILLLMLYLSAPTSQPSPALP
jgi:hypothetical protein